MFQTQLNLVCKYVTNDGDDPVLFTKCYGIQITWFLLQAKTDKLSPMLVSLPKPQRPKLLLPPGRWTTYREDESIVSRACKSQNCNCKNSVPKIKGMGVFYKLSFIFQQFPFETFVPKLQFLSIVLPKELPRLVKIERLRRKFLAANIKVCSFTLISQNKSKPLHARRPILY